MSAPPAPVAPPVPPGDRHLQRFLLRLRAVVARNLELQGAPGKRPRPVQTLPDTAFRILAQDPDASQEDGALETLHESTVCPQTLNPSWMVLDLDDQVLAAKWRRTHLFTVEVVERCLGAAGKSSGALHATAVLASPATSCYAVPEAPAAHSPDDPDSSSLDVAPTGASVRVDVDLRDLWPVGCGMVDLPSLPSNAVLFSLRMDGARDSRNPDTEALFAPRSLCAALKQFGLIEPPMDFRGSSMAKAVLEDGDDGPLVVAELDSLADDLKERRAKVEAMRDEAAASLGPKAHLAPEAKSIAAHQLEALRDRVAASEAALAREEALLEQEEARLAQETDDVKALMALVTADQHDVAALEKEAKAAEASYLRTLFLLEARQTRLLAELQSIYPLQQLPSREWAIRGLELPRDLLHKDDEHVSSALGYAAHLVLMLSKYLGVSLRYQILYYSSRSAIRDEVRDGPQATANTYYLFRRGVERERFERAVRMLGWNVEQILRARDVVFERGLSMLGNLHNLFVHEMDPRIA